MCFGQYSVKVDENDPNKKSHENPIKIDPKNLYSPKELLICLFCNRDKCVHENYLEHPNNNVIKGLNSNQIDENLFASQRPSNVLIDQFNLIEQFKEKNIGLIVNVQRPGEHPWCGPNNGLDLESGFSYSPSKFESNGIKVALRCWSDLNVPDSLNFMLVTVKLMFYYINVLHKKILVHCHAGYGRTGITIACYKIFTEKTKAEKVIEEIRSIRKKCIQNKNQFNYCKMFYEFCLRKMEIFSYDKKDINLFLNNQNDLNVGKYHFKFFDYNELIPIILLYLFDHLLDIKEKNQILSIDIYKSFNQINFNENIKLNKDFDIYIENINNGNFEIIKTCQDIKFIAEMIFYWLYFCVNYCISTDNILKLPEDFTHYEKCFKEYELKIIMFFIKIFILLDNKEKTEEENREKNLMMNKLFDSLIGFTNKDNKIFTQKFNNFIQFLYPKTENQEIIMNNEAILENIYDSIEMYYKSKSQLDTNISSKILVENINSILNQNSKKEIKINNKSNIFQKQSKKPWIIEEDC